jgi:hypothetical protein
VRCRFVGRGAAAIGFWDGITMADKEGTEGNEEGINMGARGGTVEGIKMMTGDGTNIGSEGWAAEGWHSGELHRNGSRGVDNKCSLSRPIRCNHGRGGRGVRPPPPPGRLA